MNALLARMRSNPINRRAFEFLEADEIIHTNSFIPANELKSKHEGLDDFFGLSLPQETKYCVASKGLMLYPSTGEIFAIQFGRHDIVFKLCEVDKDLGTFPSLRYSFFKACRIWNGLKLGLNYFSNVDGDYAIDTRILGRPWALSIYFVGELEEKIGAYYQGISSRAIIDESAEET